MKKINETKRILTEWRKNFISESYYDDDPGLPRDYNLANKTAEDAMLDAEASSLSGFDAADAAYHGYHDDDSYDIVDDDVYDDEGKVSFRVNTEYHGDELVFGVVNKHGQTIKIVDGPEYLDERDYGRVEINGMEEICDALDDLGVELVIDIDEERIPYDEWREYNC